MSRFYGSLKGAAKSTATRRGHPASGVEAHVRGWDIGGVVRAWQNARGNDCITFGLTGGSNANAETLQHAPASNVTFELFPDGHVEKW